MYLNVKLDPLTQAPAPVPLGFRFAPVTCTSPGLLPLGPAPAPPSPALAPPSGAPPSLAPTWAPPLPDSAGPLAPGINNFQFQLLLDAVTPPTPPVQSFLPVT